MRRCVTGRRGRCSGLATIVGIGLRGSGGGGVVLAGRGVVIRGVMGL